MDIMDSIEEYSREVHLYTSLNLTIGKPWRYPFPVCLVGDVEAYRPAEEKITQHPHFHSAAVVGRRKE